MVHKYLVHPAKFAGSAQVFMLFKLYDKKTRTNSADPDQWDLDLHCLPVN